MFNKFSVKFYLRLSIKITVVRLVKQEIEENSDSEKSNSEENEVEEDEVNSNFIEVVFTR
jgi:hypothetical protein